MWDAVPGFGKLQCLIFAFLFEFHSEMTIPGKKAHYTKGGPLPGNADPASDWVAGDPLGFAASMSPETLRRKQNAELNNGRLAMIGIMSFSAASTIPGSVPALDF